MPWQCHQLCLPSSSPAPAAQSKAHRLQHPHPSSPEMHAIDNSPPLQWLQTAARMLNTAKHRDGLLHNGVVPTISSVAPIMLWQPA